MTTVTVSHLYTSDVIVPCELTNHYGIVTRAGVITLLRAGAALDLVDQDGQTALMHMAGLNHSDRPVFWPGVKELLDAKASIDSPARTGDLLLCRACLAGQSAVVEALLAHQADVHALDTLHGHKTPLLLTVSSEERGKPENLTRIAISLLEHRADLDAQDSMGDTALMIAVRHSHTGLTRLLLTRYHPTLLHMYLEFVLLIQSQFADGESGLSHCVID